MAEILKRSKALSVNPLKASQPTGAALAFLGVGIPPPTPSWGEMLRTGKSYLYEAPTYAVLPGLALTLTILSLDTLGRGLANVLEDRREVAEDEA